MNRPSPRPAPPLRLVPAGPSLRAQATWLLRKIRNLATVLRTHRAIGHLLPGDVAVIEESPWAAIVRRKQVETEATYKGAE